jgi:glycosyltransferase involved in cell wall biosynthesis
MDLVSVVIPTRNRRDRLAQAIESAKAQTWPNLEIIVVDDGSTDGTPAYLQEEQAADGRVRFIRNELPQGGAGARNTGISAAKGKYVAFLDDDDLWYPEKTEKQLALLMSNPDASAVSCGFVIERALLPSLKVRITPPSDEQEILRWNRLGGASMCLVKRNAVLDAGGFDQKLPSGQDWDLWIKLHRAGEVIVSDEPLVRYVSHQGDRISTNAKAIYAGRRRLFFRYRSRMAPDTAAFLFGELLYTRKFLLGDTWRSKLSGLAQVLRYARGGQTYRFLYRAVKSLLPNCT